MDNRAEEIVDDFKTETPTRMYKSVSAWKGYSIDKNFESLNLEAANWDISKLVNMSEQAFEWLSWKKEKIVRPMKESHNIEHVNDEIKNLV